MTHYIWMRSTGWVYRQFGEHNSMKLRRHRLPFGFLFLAIFYAAQLFGTTIRTAGTPTEYTQCSEMNSSNMQHYQELSSAFNACHTGSTTGSYRNDVCFLSTGTPIGTYQGCVSQAQNLCQYSEAMANSLEDCQDKVAQYKEAKDLFTSADRAEREKDSSRKLLYDLTKGTKTVAGLTMTDLPKKIFKSQMNRIQTINDNVLAQLKESLKAIGGFGVYRQGSSGQSFNSEPWRSLYNSHRDVPSVVMATFLLANSHAWGDGAVSDQVPALAKRFIDLIKVSASGGDPLASYILGESYYAGLGVEKDLDKFAAWKMAAASEGSTLALDDLGWYCSSVLHNPEGAREWYQLSADLGSKYSLDQLAKLGPTKPGTLRSTVSPPVDPAVIHKLQEQAKTLEEERKVKEAEAATPSQHPEPPVAAVAPQVTDGLYQCSGQVYVIERGSEGDHPLPAEPVEDYVLAVHQGRPYYESGGGYNLLGRWSMNPYERGELWELFRINQGTVLTLGTNHLGTQSSESRGLIPLDRGGQCNDCSERTVTETWIVAERSLSITQVEDSDVAYDKYEYRCSLLQ